MRAMRPAATPKPCWAATISQANLLILRGMSHLAFLQDPAQFNFAILLFLGDQ
jgi:pimeloyl-ACP methyl ester carboxylesterase